MKKVINPRLSLVCAFSVVLGILCFHEALFANYVPIVVFCVFVTTGLILFACRKNKLWRLLAFSLALFAFVFFLCWGNYFRSGENEDCVVSGTLTGRVTDIGRNGEVKNTIYLEDCSLDGEKVRGRVKMHTYDGSQFETGNVVTVYGTLRKVYVFKDETDVFAVKNRIFFELTDVKNCVVQTGELTFAEKVRNYVFEITAEYMPKNGNVAYALLTGDRNAISDEIKDAYNAAGIMHLLAVSGLHVGFVVAVFGFVLKFCKLRPLAELAILMVPLSFYAYVCNFSPSILRAILMTCCVYVVRALFGKYDLLSSLCWAVTVILMVQPLYLFDVGFQLSAMSVFGISTVYLQIDRMIRRRKLPKLARWIVSTTAMSFSCVIATAFVSAYHLGTVAFWGIVVNLLAIPLVFVSFVTCFVGLLPGLFHKVLWLADNLLQVLSEAAAFFGRLNATASFKTVAAGVVVSVLLLFVLGGYVNLSKVGKRLSYAICSLALAVCVCVAFLPVNCKNCVKVFWGYNDVIVVATSDKNQAALVGKFNDEFVFSDAFEWLSRTKANATIYLTDFSAANGSLVSLACERFEVKTVYVLDSSGNSSLTELLDQNDVSVVRVQPNTVVGDSVTVQPVYDGGLTAVVVKVADITVADVVSVGTRADRFADFRTDVDYFVIGDSAEYFSSKHLPTISFYQQDFDANFGANKYGNFTILQKDDKIVLNFRRN